MSRRASFGGAALILMLTVPLGAQDRASATSKPPGPMPNFTGSVANVGASDVRGFRFKYEAGARSYWHVHDTSLLLLIEQGRGRYQIKGQPLREFGPGEPVVLPANVAHWHGASPKEGLTWVGLSLGGNVKWMEPVSEEEYLGKVGR
jgi:quercetin dioxygenase-like cupin family protein